jgi:CRP-like cAMP-binding protein
MTTNQNRFLAALSPDLLDRLTPRLTAVRLLQGATVFEVGQPIENALFLQSGGISLVVPMQDGQMVEAAIVGNDSVLGGAAALGGEIALTKALVQIGGNASAVDIKTIRQLAGESDEFRASLVRHEQGILAQAQQSAACNVTHPVEARLARWLLRSRDVTGSSMLPLTQEFIAEMLGVRRTSVSVAAYMLQEAGFIRYRRGHIQILDGEGLRATACECYGAVKAQHERLFATDPEFSRRASSGLGQ